MSGRFDRAQAFGELRSALHAPPSAEGWEVVCAELDRWPEAPGRDEALPYAQEHLSRWPDALRIAPTAWIIRGLEGGPRWRLEVCRAVMLTPEGFPARTGQALVSAVSWPEWSRASTVSLARLPLSCVEAPEVFAAPLWASARHVSLVDVGWGAAEVAASLDAGLAEQLTSLNLSVNPLGDASLRLLASTPALEALDTLRLARSLASADGLMHLASSPHLGALRALDLSNTPLRDDDWRTLASTPSVIRLDALDMGSCRLSGRVCSALFGRRTWLSGASRLNLSFQGDTFGDEGAMVLAHAIPSEALRVLALDANGIHTPGAQALAASSRLSGLERLLLRFNALDRLEHQRLFARSRTLRECAIILS